MSQFTKKSLLIAFLSIIVLNINYILPLTGNILIKLLCLTLKC